MSLFAPWALETASKTPLRTAHAGRVGIGHALVDNCSANGACASIIAHARANGRPAYVITPNAQHIVLLQKDERFRRIYGNADLVIADGASLLLAARLHGRYLQERIAGVDVFQQLCGLAAESGLRVFLLGGRTGSADLAADALRRQFPGLVCTTCCPPFGFEETTDGLQAVADAIREVQPHLLFVGLGAPKQEFWIHDHGLQLSVPICLGVGGSFELVGGVISRAPAWVQNMACEWLYRLLCEPRRMWRRYLIGNLEFTRIVLEQRARRVLLNTFVRLAANNRFGAELHEFLLVEEPQQAVTPVPEGTPTVIAQVHDTFSI